MELADFIRLGQQDPPLRFLIIGGYAVGAHGHTRATFDVDFLVRRLEHDLWFDRIRRSGLSLFAETQAFAQFTQVPDGDGLDLMFVSEPTFEQLWTDSEERDFGGTMARVPCLDHLLALKLHVLKQGLSHRTAKDADDVEMLVRRNKIDLQAPRYEQLFLKCAIGESMKRSSESSVIREAGGPYGGDLNLPVEPGLTPNPPRVSLASMVARSRQLRTLFPAGIPSAEERWRAKSELEFHL